MPKAVVITPFMLFKLVRIPYGLPNAAQTFQCFMDQVLHGLTFPFHYIDDLLIVSEDSEENKIHLCMIFERLQDHGVLINPPKY